MDVVNYLKTKPNIGAQQTVLQFYCILKCLIPRFNIFLQKEAYSRSFAKLTFLIKLAYRCDKLDKRNAGSARQ